MSLRKPVAIMGVVLGYYLTDQRNKYGKMYADSFEFTEVGRVFIGEDAHAFFQAHQDWNIDFQLCDPAHLIIGDLLNFYPEDRGTFALDLTKLVGLVRRDQVAKWLAFTAPALRDEFVKEFPQ